MELCVDGGRTYGTVPAMWRPLVKAICARDARRVAKALDELPCDDYYGDIMLLGLSMRVEREYKAVRRHSSLGWRPHASPDEAFESVCNIKQTLIHVVRELVFLAPTGVGVTRLLTTADFDPAGEYRAMKGVVETTATLRHPEVLLLS